MEQYNLWQIDKNSNYLTGNILTIIDALYQRIVDFCKEKDNTPDKNKDENKYFDYIIYRYIFIKNYLNDIINIYKDVKKKMHDEDKIDFILTRDNTLPEQIPVYIENECSNCLTVPKDFKYAYTDKNESTINIGLDSNPEIIFANHIKDLIKFNKDLRNKLKIWTKNPVFDGIKFEYLDSELRKTSSYTDFILK
ncbi:hypothetical protein ACXYRP_03585 [Mycoplasma sp. 5912]